MRGLHPADLAVVLAREAAEVMVELDASARAWLVDQTDRHRLTKIASNFDPARLFL